MKKRTKKAVIVPRRSSPRKTPIRDRQLSPKLPKVIPMIVDGEVDGAKPLPPLAPKKTIKLTITELKDDQPIAKVTKQDFGGKLSLDQADISLTTPLGKDKKRFQAALQELPETLANYTSSPAKATKNKLPQIKCLHLGVKTAMAPWYSAPFPAEYYTKDGQLWMCEWCLKYIRCQKTMKRHIKKCAGRPPPGNEIYRHGNLSVFEVNGRSSKFYCQNLCLLAKMFLDHKTLYYDVETFLFYVLIEWHPVCTLKPTSKRRATLCNYSIIGYFSKEKHSPANYNLSCIMTLPNQQRKGYGQFLIDFSYLLSRKEGKQCSPEKPLSDLGLISYTSYWTRKVLQYISEHTDEEIDVSKISVDTGISINDVLGVLEHHNAIRWNPREGKYQVLLEDSVLQKFAQKMAEKQEILTVNEKFLKWIPYTCTR